MNYCLATTSTSGSQSLFRILTATIDCYNRYNADSSPIDLSMKRGSKELKTITELTKRKYIINFRDPRDIWCNQFYWLVEHHSPSEETTRARKARYDLGIDVSVLKALKSEKSGKSIFDFHRTAYEFSQKCETDNILFVSYAQLCCDFDSMLQRICDFVGVELDDEAQKTVRLEHVDNLSDNDEWIGNKWKGTDVMPGRFMTELKPETISALNDGLKETLGFLKTIEVDGLKHFYE